MNTEQTEKSLGQWAYEAFPPIPGADVPWRDSLHKDGWEKAAQAVATEVLNRLPGEWILLEPGTITEPEDMKLRADGKWERVSIGGFIVQNGIVKRRLSPVPSQQPQLGSSKEPESCPACNSLVGWLFAQNPDKTLNKARSECHSCGYTMDHVTPSPAPRAEWRPKFKVGDRVRVEGFQTTFTVEYLPHDSKDAYQMVGGYNAKEDELTAAPWKLPEPPENEQWHRTDFWTEKMLPEPYRPLLVGETIQEGDEYENGAQMLGLHWKKQSGDWSSAGQSADNFTHVPHRTTRPLPDPSTPQPEEIPYEETDLFHARKALLDEGMRANTLMQERDAALARASEVEKEFSRIQGKCEQLLRDLQAGKMPDDDGTRLIGEVRHIFRFRDQAIELEKELTTLRASVPVWVPCNRVMPTEKDANAHGRVLFGSLGSIAWSAPWNEVKNATHWMALPPLPVETEEEINFDRWWDTRAEKILTGTMGATKQAARLIWEQAALRSKKPS
jgi:hypothetical protein